MELWERLGVILLAVVFLVIGLLFMVKALFNPFDNKENQKYLLEYESLDKKFLELLKSLNIDINKGIKKEEINKIIPLLIQKLKFCYGGKDKNKDNFYGYFTIEGNYLIIHLFDYLTLSQGEKEEKTLSIPIISKGQVIPTVEYNNYNIIPLNINDWEVFKTSDLTKTCFINKNILILSNNKEIEINEEDIKRKTSYFFEKVKLKTLNDLIKENKDILFEINGCDGFTVNFQKQNSVLSCHSPILKNENSKLSFSYLFLEFNYIKQIINNKNDILTFKEYLKRILELKNGKSLENLPNLVCGKFNEKFFNTLNGKELNLELEKESLEDSSSISNQLFMKYDLNTKKLEFFLPPLKESIFNNLYLRNLFIYSVKGILNNKKEISIEEATIEKLCNANLEQAKNKAKIKAFLENGIKIITLNYLNKDIKFSELLKDNQILINTQGFLFIKKEDKIITPFGIEKIGDFKNLDLVLVVNNKNYKMNKLQEGEYCIKKIKNSGKKIIIFAKKGLC